MELLKFMLFIGLLVFWGCSSSPSKGTQNGKDTCFYLLEIPADLDVPTTPPFDTTITRTKDCTIHVLRLPSWGTETSYELTAPHEKKKENSRSSHFTQNHYGIMDITNLPPGEYKMNLFACGNGGGFTVRIK